MFLKKNSFLFLNFVILLSISSCKVDDPEIPQIEKPTYENGIFITNEGPFQNGTGTVSFYERNSGLMFNNIFQEANNGEELGNIVHSMHIHNDLAYIVVNNANKIVIANASTFEKVGEITGFELPRYFLPVSDEKAFVSQWGADGTTGSIKIIDLVSNVISNSIDTRPGPETMIKVDDFVYVANSGGFATDSVVTKIDIASETIWSTIEVGQGPDFIVADKNNDLWVLGHGNYGTGANGFLTKLSNDNLALSMEATIGASRLAINNSEDILYFSMNGMTYEHSISANMISATPLMSRYFYGFSIDPETGDFVGLDAKDFQQNGQMIIYDASGVAQDSMTVGVVPGTLWFD